MGGRTDERAGWRAGGRAGGRACYKTRVTACTTLRRRTATLINLSGLLQSVPSVQ